MAKTLKIAHDLSLPLEVVTQTIAVIAKRRAGKSYTMRRLVEQLFKAGQQVVLVDPKGDQWGLRSAADGKAPGLPIIILGGERGDVKLEASAGEVVAKLVVEERVSVLLDLSIFRKSEVATFMTAFLETLYRLKAKEIYRTPVMLVIDEADAVAPQKPQHGEERMLGAAEDIVRRGGQRGIGCVLVTQRSAVLNKNVLTQAQILIALRTIAPQDLAAMNAWIDVHGTIEQRKTLMESLPSLPVGDAWVWSPGWPTVDGIFKRVHVLPIETFDSGKSPEPGAKPVEPKQAADVDLQALERQMSETIQRSKRDDPKELRKVIQEQDRKIRSLEGKTFPTAAKGEDRPVLTDADRELLRKVADGVNAVEARLAGEGAESMAVAQSKAEQAMIRALTDFRADLDRLVGARQKDLAGLLERAGFQRVLAKLERVQCTPSPIPGRPVSRHTTAAPSTTLRPSPAAPPRLEVPARMPATGSGEPALKTMHRSMLIALAQHPAGLSKKQILIHTGYASSGPVSTAFADLMKVAAVESQGHGLRITDIGLALLGAYDPLPTGDALREWLLSSGKLSTMEAALLRAVASAYPNAIRKGEVLEQVGYASSGPVSSAFAKLVGLNYVRSQGPSMLVASEELFS